MRIVIFLLLLINVYSEPSRQCKDDASKCLLADFEYNEETDRQCYYNHFDSGHEPWSLTIDDKYKRKECDFWLKCKPISRERQIVLFARKVIEGNNRDTKSTVQQEAIIHNIQQQDIKNAARDYYNRDICQVDWVPTAILIGILVLFVSICGCLVVPCIIERWKAGGKYQNLVGAEEEVEEEKNEMPLYRHRRQRIF